jgi:hypothetical protein
MGVVSNSLFQI